MLTLQVLVFLRIDDKKRKNKEESVSLSGDDSFSLLDIHLFRVVHCSWLN
jgi:hypothetical protein